ncbi:hypothetical protein OCU04_000353 [Sclerotinia nivalis]|uniref:Uncharacterized protein n=1 Tax=Sclerotinia nivalis TaxID=352851 RepID=A0A9X0DQ86_9HELO|nr:hypothetical protein OCU04_000353 [Sclerotinia nivalis]
MYIHLIHMPIWMVIRDPTCLSDRYPLREFTGPRNLGSTTLLFRLFGPCTFLRPKKPPLLLPTLLPPPNAKPASTLESDSSSEADSHASSSLLWSVSRLTLRREEVAVSGTPRPFLPILSFLIWSLASLASPAPTAKISASVAIRFPLLQLCHNERYVAYRDAR